VITNLFALDSSALERSPEKRMKITPSVIGGVLVVALILIVLLKVRAQDGILPPHEFAYGTALRSPNAIPEQIDRFLSLEALDPNEVQIETYVGNNSEKNLKPLIKYISSQRSGNFGSLLATLKSVDQISNQKEKAIQFLKTLLPYKGQLRDESQQDTIIVFVYYGLKQPASLPPSSRAKISTLVRQLDTAKQSVQFESGKCPRNYLVGNVNIYPLAFENTLWHNFVKFGSSKDAPILEIRFMGLKGIFRYLLDEMTERTGDSFLHLDGESL
jgi:hypothetical protein